MDLVYSRRSDATSLRTLHMVPAFRDCGKIGEETGRTRVGTTFQLIGAECERTCRRTKPACPNHQRLCSVSQSKGY